MNAFLKSRGRMLLAAGVVIGLALPALSGAAAKAAVPAAPGGQEWVARFSGPDTGFAGIDIARAVALSPDGSTVFVTGSSNGSHDAGDYATIAYNAATGAQVWATRYDGPDQEGDDPTALAVSPGGTVVFVTGTSEGASGTLEYATIAYNAATGAQLWVSRYSGNPAGSLSFAKSLVVSPDGGVVYVTGYSGGGNGNDYVTIAYNTATGAQLWASRYDHGGNDQGRAVVLSPNGKTVYVTGRSVGVHGFDDATVAYNAATGTQLWTARYNNSKANGNEFANAITVSPGGKTVFITGGSAGKKSNTDFATIAYGAAHGKQLWVSRYNGPGNFIDSGTALAVTPNGQTLVVTGPSWGGTGSISTNTDYATIAYSASTGAAHWTKRYTSVPGGYDGDNPAGVVISPDGGTVYVTGDSDSLHAEDNYATVAYATTNGQQLWVSEYDGPAHSFDGATALALNPAGTDLYVVGFSVGGSGEADDFATIAYRT